VHEWAATNCLELNPIKVIVISHCRVDILPPTLLLGSNLKVIPKVNNLGFVFNERLTATSDHLKKVCQKVYWILRSSNMHRIHRLKLGGGWFCRGLHLFPL
jgi:hypothetical protein